MTPQTKANLNVVESALWFSRAGEKGSDNVVVVNNWNEAVKWFSGQEWQQLENDAANTLAENVCHASRQRFSQWNDLVRELKPLVKELVRRKIKKVVDAFGLPLLFEDLVEWDMIHLLLESEYVDITPPGWFSGQAYWYINGRFPCGWNGDYPAGKLVIY